MKRQRGFIQILPFLMGPVGRWVLIAIAAAVLWGHGYTTGVSRESDRRDAAQLQAERAMWDGFVRRIDLGRQAVTRAIAAERRSDDYHRQLQGRIADAKNAELAVPNCPPPGSPPAAAGDRPAFNLTWGFVGLWDASWTDHEGQPVFGDPDGTAERALVASPVDPRALLENHRENARLCSADRARLARLTQLIDQLEKDWARQSPD